MVWAHRQPLAQEARERCRGDTALRGWLAALPLDASIYDLRAPSPARGWPYGLVGPDSRLYRCGRLPVFAVTAGPSAGRWSRFMGEVARNSDLPKPAVARSVLSSSLRLGRHPVERGTALGQSGSPGSRPGGHSRTRRRRFRRTAAPYEMARSEGARAPSSLAKSPRPHGSQLKGGNGQEARNLGIV